MARPTPLADPDTYPSRQTRSPVGRRLGGAVGRRFGLALVLLGMLSVLLSLPSTGSAVTAKTDVTGPMLVMGDSLSAEYGLKRGTGWVALMSARMAQENIKTPVVNASISGETTAGGKSRIAELLQKHKPAWVLIELGGNDALRGLDLAGTEANLRAMAQASRAAGARVVIVGMQVPPNYGKTYSRQFAAVFEQVAKAEQAVLVPFLLEGVGDRLELFQADRIHPNEAAQVKMLDNVWRVIGSLIKGAGKA